MPKVFVYKTSIVYKGPLGYAILLMKGLIIVINVLKVRNKPLCKYKEINQPWSSGYGRRLMSQGCGFKSRHHILDGHVSHLFVVKTVIFV